MLDEMLDDTLVERIALGNGGGAEGGRDESLVTRLPVEDVLDRIPLVTKVLLA